VSDFRGAFQSQRRLTSSRAVKELHRGWKFTPEFGDLIYLSHEFAAPLRAKNIFDNPNFVPVISSRHVDFPIVVLSTATFLVLAIEGWPRCRYDWHNFMSG
jgi:hypothetical protein